MAVVEAETAPLVARALEAQRMRTARVLALVRLAGVAAALVLGLARAYAAGEQDWRVLLPILGGYAAGAFALFGAVRVSARAARWAGLGVAFIDVPMVFLVACSSPVERQAAATTSVTVFEGARLITGDGGAAIENSAFIVANNQFTRVGRRGEVQVPAAALRVDLSGKTVMPTLSDLHGHFGFQNVAAGTMSKQSFTRENLIAHLERLAYVGVGAVVGVGDLVDRAEPNGGRTGWGDVPLRVRDEIIPNAALFRTAGPGMAWPGSGAQGHASRVDVSYPVTTVADARTAVQDYIRIKPEFIKIWVDSRGGRKQTLTPELYRAIIDEAHKYDVPVAVHNVTLADAKEMMRAGIDGWLHVPVRAGEVAQVTHLRTAGFQAAFVWRLVAQPEGLCRLAEAEPDRDLFHHRRRSCPAGNLTAS